MVGGGAAAAIRGAGLTDRVTLVERAEAETGLLLITPRAVCKTVGALNPDMDDGADLPLLDFALRARTAGIAVRVLDEALPPKAGRPDPVAPRRTFMARWAKLETPYAIAAPPSTHHHRKSF